MYCKDKIQCSRVFNCLLQHRQLETIQSAANKIANQARELSNDANYESPFCKHAAKEGIHYKGEAYFLRKHSATSLAEQIPRFSVGKESLKPTFNSFLKILAIIWNE